MSGTRRTLETLGYDLAILAAVVASAAFAGSLVEYLLDTAGLTEAAGDGGDPWDALAAALLNAAVYGIGIFYPLYAIGAVVHFGLAYLLGKRWSPARTRLAFIGLSPLVGAVFYVVVAPGAESGFAFFAFGVPLVFAAIAKPPSHV